MLNIWRKNFLIVEVKCVKFLDFANKTFTVCKSNFSEYYSDKNSTPGIASREVYAVSWCLMCNMDCEVSILDV